MRAHHRLARSRDLADILDLLEPLMRLAAARMGRGMDHRPPVDPLLGFLGQRVVGAIAVEERGRPAGIGRRHFEGAQQARRRRYVDERAVGMPERLAVAEPADRLAVFDDVGDHRDFRGDLALAANGLGLDPILLGDQCGGIEFELAELTGERHVLLVGHRLAAKAQHEVGEPSSADRFAVGGRERVADVDAGDLGTEPRCKRPDGDAHGRYSAASSASTP